MFLLFKMFSFCQTLRAQEAAQAEAEEREDLEIAAEAAGIFFFYVIRFLSGGG